MPEFIGRPREDKSSQMADQFMAQSIVGLISPALQQMSKMNDLQIQMQLEQEKVKQRAALEKEQIELKAGLEAKAATATELAKQAAAEKEQKAAKERSQIAAGATVKAAEVRAGTVGKGKQVKTPMQEFLDSVMGRAAQKELVEKGSVGEAVAKQLESLGAKLEKIDPFFGETRYKLTSSLIAPEKTSAKYTKIHTYPSGKKAGWNPATSQWEPISGQ